MPIVKVKHQKKVKDKTSILWKEVKPKKNEDLHQLICGLKMQRKDFKIIENKVEKNYNYNGNNYLISSVFIRD